MRISIPGLRGLYYDTDAESPAVTIAMTAAGRRAPKPQGYAIQLLPYLWSFDVDLREVPTDHPIQYLHPEGARSLGQLPAEGGVRRIGSDLESVVQFVWAVNEQVDTAAGRLVGQEREQRGRVIEIDDGAVAVDGETLETDAFDIEDDSTSITTIEIEEGPLEDADDERDDAFDVDESTPAEFDATELDHDAFDPDTDEFETGEDDGDAGEDRSDDAADR